MENNPEQHTAFMRRCFSLAKLGNSFVAPNPMVGAVLVHEGRIIGEGFHERYGDGHAEVNCLNSVLDEDKEFISRSTLYVSLEPCAHFGKTPPCADLIIEHKIPRVVISVTDPHHIAQATGTEKLKAAGVEVLSGILEAEGRQLIRHFLCYHEKKRPFITLKWAESAEGFIGRKDQRIQISNALSQQYAHQLRADHEAILIGKNTLISDNPQLTVRHAQGKDPVRIVLCADGCLPEQINILQKEKGYTIILNEKKHSITDHVEWIRIDSTRDIRNVLHALHELKIISVLVEGGTEVLNSFIGSGFWDEAYIFRSNILLGYGIHAPGHPATPVQEHTFDNDSLMIFKNPHDLSLT